MAQPLATPRSPSETTEELGERIAELSAEIQAATYQLLTLIREFDERSGWEGGFRSCAYWLNWRTGLHLGAAREKVRVARALADLPRISEAMSRGELSYSKVRALTRVATADNEDELLSFARAGTAHHVEMLVRSWRRLDRAEEGERDELRRESRYLTLQPDEDGMWVIRGRLEAEALEENSERGQAALESGENVSAETSRRLACDSARVTMTHDAEDKTIDVGRKTRTIPPALRRALRHRDAGCRFPGCQVKVCDGHHVHHWADGGETRLDNLVELCRFHHRAVHEEGFRVELDAGGEASFFHPGGRPMLAAPPPPRLMRGPQSGSATKPNSDTDSETESDSKPDPRDDSEIDPKSNLAAYLSDLGISTDPDAGLPSWEGERVDYGWALESLWRPPRPETKAVPKDVSAETST